MNFNTNIDYSNNSKNVFNSNINNEIYILKNDVINKHSLCRIYNYGNNCYMNSGLQIISRCDKFIEWINNSHYPKKECPFFNLLKHSLNKILYSEEFDPKNFMDYFHSINKDFTPDSQNCSQLFIKTVIININEEILKYIHNYKIKNPNIIVDYIHNYNPNNVEIDYYRKFLNSNNVFPQIIPYSYFSGIIKTESTGKCNKCGEVKKYSFMEFFDQHIYLDTITTSSTDFENVLKENLGYPIQIRSFCPKCKNTMQFKDISKIIKLPEILVFTIERYIGETNSIPIKPNEIINVREYVEPSMNFINTIYSLFAINIRFGYSNKFGHQICQIKNGNSWYILNDMKKPKLGNINDYNKNSYGLFYKVLINEGTNSINIKSLITKEKNSKPFCIC